MTGQSFNETRRVDVTVWDAGDGGFHLSISSMTLRGLNVPGSATVGARVYDSNTQALLATGNTVVSAGHNQTVIVAIAAPLTAAFPAIQNTFAPLISVELLPNPACPTDLNGDTM